MTVLNHPPYRVKLSLDDIRLLRDGKVLRRNKLGQAAGVGDSFAHDGQCPVEIVLDRASAEVLRAMLPDQPSAAQQT